MWILRSKAQWNIKTTVEVKRPWRVAFYYVKLNTNVVYIQSRIAALLVFKEWAAEALKQEGDQIVEFGGIVKPQMHKLINTQDIVMLLNGGWDAFVVTRVTIKNNQIIKTFTDPKYKSMHNQCNKLRIKGVYFNNTIRKALSVVCKQYDLIELCFRCPSPNVFEAYLKLLQDINEEEKELIIRHAKNIFYVLRKPYRKTT